MKVRDFNGTPRELTDIIKRVLEIKSCEGPLQGLYPMEHLQAAYDDLMENPPKLAEDNPAVGIIDLSSVPDLVDIHHGDRFLFKGLAGTSYRFNRMVEIIALSVTGTLTVSIETEGDSQPPQNTYRLPYSEAVKMIEDGLWERIT